MATNLNQILWGEGVAFIDGVEAFEVQELALNIGMEILEATKGDGGGKITIPTQQPITGRCGFLGLNASIFSKLTGATTATGTKKRMREESGTVDNTTYTITLSQTPIADTLRVVPTGDKQKPFVRVASNPSQGEYSVSGNTLTFNSADAGKTMKISYIYSDTTSGETSKLSPTALPSSFSLYGTLRTKELFSDTKGDVVFYAAKCERTSEFGLGGAIGNISTPGFDFSVRIDTEGDFEIYWP